jgi:hypothetical protein
MELAQVVGGGDQPPFRAGGGAAAALEAVLDDDGGFGETGGLLEVEQLVAYAGVEGLDVGTGDCRIAVTVRQSVRDLGGTLLSEGLVSHVYTLRDGLVAWIDLVSRV